jgi:hypothetical protein
MSSSIRDELPRLYMNAVESMQKHLEMERDIIARLKRVQNLTELQEVIKDLDYYYAAADNLLAAGANIVTFLKENKDVH